METAMDRIDDKNKLISHENKKLRQQLGDRETKLNAQSDVINNLEQYTQRNSVRIYGVHDSNPKETSM